MLIVIIFVFQSFGIKLTKTKHMTTEKLNIPAKEWASMGYEKANELLAPMALIERLEVLQNVPASMVPYEYWIRKSKAELMQLYMNAFTTQSCLGHSKAERNERAANNYLELMAKYNVPTPPSDICYILGIFNGAGSQ